MRRRGGILFAFVLGLAGLSSRHASAYVREVTSTGVPIAWRNPCVTMHIYLGSPPPVLTAADYFAASTLAMAAWSYPQVACTDIRLNGVAETQASAGVGYDKSNVIVFRQTTWCRDPAPVDDAGIPEPDCYPGSALAVTSIFKNVKTGEIVDAATALEWGLVSRLTPPELLMEEAHELAAGIAHQPPGVLRMTKKLMREGLSANLETIMDMSASYQARAHASADHAEALAAFFEKREPDFTGR